MKIHGYCTGCRKIRRVDATGLAVALSQARGGIIEGVCDDCVEEATKKEAPRRGVAH